MTKQMDDRSDVLYKAGCVTLLFLTLIVVTIGLKVLLLQRSLGQDEAMLAESILTRGVWELFATPLLNNQSAPFLYVIAVKILTILQGPSEIVLRLCSFLAYLGALVLTGVMLRRLLRVNMLLSLTGVCLFASLLLVVRYATELKPYMGDAFFVLLVLCVYGFYLQQKAGWKVTTAVLIVVLWCSHPACFFVAAVLTVEFLRALFSKNRSRLCPVIIAGIMVSISFMLNYFALLKPMTDEGYMTNFWSMFAFRLFSLHGADWINNFGILSFLFKNGFGQVYAIYVLLGAIGLIVSIARKDLAAIATGTALLLLLGASSFSFYPVADRLMMFIYALIIIYAMVCLSHNWLKMKKALRLVIQTVVILVLLWGNVGIYRLYYPENVYMYSDETTEIIEYVQQNIQEGESLYVFYFAVPVFKYKNNYNTAIVGKSDKTNVILGSLLGGDSVLDSVDPEKAQAELEMLLSNVDNCYILLTLIHKDRYSLILKGLQQCGSLTQVKNINNTLLLYFTPDKDKVETYLETHQIGPQTP